MPLRFDLTAGDNGRMCLDGVPENFRAVIRQAETIHAESMPHLRRCALMLFQGELPPGRNFGVIDPHIDGYIESYPDAVTDMDNFIVSDSLPTVFYKQGFALPDHVFASKDETYWRLSEIFMEQAKPECQFIPEPYHLVRFGPLAVHASQVATQPTFRTAAILRFH